LGFVIEQAEEYTWEEWLTLALILFLAFFFMFPEFSAAFAIVNDMLDGWILHFYTVVFVESLEALEILIFYRITLKRI